MGERTVKIEVSGSRLEVLLRRAQATRCAVDPVEQGGRKNETHP